MAARTYASKQAIHAIGSAQINVPCVHLILRPSKIFLFFFRGEASAFTHNFLYNESEYFTDSNHGLWYFDEKSNVLLHRLHLSAM